MSDFPNIEQVIKQAAPLMAEAIRDSAIGNGLFKSGKLAGSYQGRAIVKDNNFSIEITGEDYGLYQDSGINGTKIKVSPAQESIYPPGQFQSKVIGGPLPFAARKSIAEKGLKPRPFIQSGINQVTNNFLIPKLEEAGVEDANNIIVPPSKYLKET